MSKYSALGRNGSSNGPISKAGAGIMRRNWSRLTGGRSSGDRRLFATGSPALASVCNSTDLITREATFSPLFDVPGRQRRVEPMIFQYILPAGDIHVERIVTQKRDLEIGESVVDQLAP